jgi:4-aminobutyrate aminotransferase-like enzyme
MDAPGPGGLGGTYAGSPLACAAALAVLDVFESEACSSAPGRSASASSPD